MQKSVHIVELDEASAAACVERIEPCLAAARAEGRSQLLEHEALAVVAALGFEVPARAVVPDAGAAAKMDLSSFPGARVVVKALSPELSHKTELGAVAVVPREPAEVAAAIEAMTPRLAGTPLAGFLVAQYVEHDLEPGGELLLGLRWSREFGPVVTLGLGGVTAEAIASGTKPEAGLALFSPALDGADTVAALLSADGPHGVLGALATGKLRGRRGRCDLGEVATAVEHVLDLAWKEVPELLDELEVNPLSFVHGRPWALDALVRISAGVETPEPPRPLERAARLLHPRSIAVMGVSARSLNPARLILRNTLAAGFPAERIRIVKPGANEIDGVACVPDLASLAELANFDGPVDMLVLAIPAEDVPGVLEEVVAERLAEGIVLIPGGLGEREGTAELAERIGATLRRARANEDWSGPVVNGPNCLGMRSAPGRIDTLFIPHAKLPLVPEEPVTPHAPTALLSQSGAFAIARQSRLPWLAPRELVTFGNQLDLTAADWLDVMAEDAELAVIACYVEGFRPGDGLRFARRARELAAAGRALVVYRAGRTLEGVLASASHTASLAGDPAATRALLTRAGALVADSIDDFEDLIRLASCLANRRVGGRRLGVMSNAGFECVAMADNLAPLELARLDRGTYVKLERLFERAGLAGFLDVHHPLDVTPIAGDATFSAAAGILLDDPGIDVGLVACVPLTGELATLEDEVGSADGVATRLVELWNRTDLAFAAVVDSGPLYDAFAARLQAAGIPTFRSADRAVRLLGRYAAWRSG